MPSPEIGLLLELVLDLKKDITAVQKDVTTLKSEAAANTVTLEDHARRSTASEARLALLEKREWMVNGFFKISLSLVSLTGAVLGILAAIRHL